MAEAVYAKGEHAVDIEVPQVTDGGLHLHVSAGRRGIRVQLCRHAPLFADRVPFRACEVVRAICSAPVEVVHEVFGGFLA